MNARHNGEAGRKIVSSARGEEGRTASSPPPPRRRRSNRLGKIRKEIRTAKAERQRSRVGRRGARSRREMGELEHFPLVDTQRL